MYTDADDIPRESSLIPAKASYWLCRYAPKNYERETTGIEKTDFSRDKKQKKTSCTCYFGLYNIGAQHGALCILTAFRHDKHYRAIDTVSQMLNTFVTLFLYNPNLLRLNLSICHVPVVRALQRPYEIFGGLDATLFPFSIHRGEAWRLPADCEWRYC